VKVALGADHGGFALKESLKGYVQNRGLSFEDLGTESDQSTDYPDFAQKVAKAVAGGRAEFGVLVCTTGVGMSMAANKVPGVRAALTHDAETADMARRHNNANVLCLAGTTTSMRTLDAFWMLF
jgi:ribose 5-phosphate isomerase B